MPRIYALLAFVCEDWNPITVEADCALRHVYIPGPAKKHLRLGEFFVESTKENTLVNS